MSGEPQFPYETPQLQGVSLGVAMRQRPTSGNRGGQRQMRKSSKEHESPKVRHCRPTPRARDPVRCDTATSPATSAGPPTIKCPIGSKNKVIYVRCECKRH